MDKFKVYQKTYPKLLIERRPFQLKKAEEISRRVKQERKQEQKLYTKLKEKKRLQNSEFFFNILKTMN